MQAGSTGFASVSLNNIDWLISYTPLPSSNWALGVVFPRSEMYASLKSIAIVLVLLIVVGLTLLTILISRIVSKQIAPLRLFAASVFEVADGNFDASLPEISTEDEMKTLLDSFRKMQKNSQVTEIFRPLQVILIEM